MSPKRIQLTYARRSSRETTVEASEETYCQAKQRNRVVNPLKATHGSRPALAVVRLHAVDHNIGNHRDYGKNPTHQVEGQLRPHRETGGETERLTELDCSRNARTIMRYRYSPSHSIQQ